jgi:hypothetical protein
MREKTKEELLREHRLKWHKARVRRIVQSFKHSREFIENKQRNFNQILPIERFYWEACKKCAIEDLQ